MPSLAPNKPTVLVVDDDSAVLNLCRTVLGQEGFTILSADGSSDALKICKQHSGTIDLLLTDLVLPPPGFSLASSDNEFPHVHGHDLALRALRMREQLRIVLMSGNIDKDLASYGIRKATLPFISKPFENTALVALVRAALEAPPPTVESLMNQPTKHSAGLDEWVD